MTTQAPTPIEALKLRLERACDCEPDILWECGPCKDITAIESLERALATSEAKLKEAGIEYDRLVERSVGAMAIAEGEEGYEKVRIDCPMLDAVLKLRMRLEKARELLTEIRPQVDMVRGSWFDRTDAFLTSTDTGERDDG